MVSVSFCFNVGVNLNLRLKAKVKDLRAHVHRANPNLTKRLDSTLVNWKHEILPSAAEEICIAPLRSVSQ